MGAADDFDGDGISNFNDIDSDNDGVLDFIECAPTASMKRYNNGTAATWNGTTTITADVNSTTFISAQTSTGGGVFLNRIITGSANTANNVYTNNYRITGTRNDFWLLNKDGVDNNSGNITYTFSQPIPISELIVLIEDVDYRTSGSAPTVTISLQGVGTTATTLDLTPYKSGTLDLPNPNNANNGGYNTATGIITYNVPILGTGTNENRAYALVGNSNKLVKSIKIAYNLDEKANLYIGRVQENCDNDGDGVSNIFDLDSDGDGCPDALEAGAISYAKIKNGTYSSGTLVNSGGSTTTNPFAIVGNKTIPANYGTNGFYSSIESADTFAATYTSSYTYEDAINNSKADACKDTDGDGIPDVLDIDDDNDGILDKIECPSGFVNLVNGGGFTTDPPTPNWYFANSTSNYDTPFVGFPFGYGGTQTNSTNTGGLFDQIDGNNTNTAGFNALIEINGATDALVSTFNQTLVAGATYQFSYDAGLRGGSGVAGQNCTLQLYNADTNTVQSVLSSIPLNNLPAFPNYLTISGSFTVPVSGNYYLLFMNAGNGGAGNDYIIDRVVTIGNLGSPSICDFDGDGVPNYLDLDTDGDGCSDLVESGVSPSTDISTPSSTTNNVGGSYGIAPNKLTGSQLNPNATDANNDGLNDSVDPDTNGVPNYPSTYNLYALSKILNACTDTDNDGIIDLKDIDDDNDGVLDAVESPNCFYKESEVNKPVSFKTELNPYSTASNGIGNSFDSDTNTYSQFANGQNWVGKSIVEITLATPLAISSLDFLNGVNNLSTDTSSTFRLQGWDGTTWIDLSNPMANASTANFSISNTLQIGKEYSKYRLVGVAGTCQYGGIKEITFTTYQYSPSSHPKPTCTTDTDGDGIFNHQDLDSDGDGCPDAVEAGVVNKVGVANTSTGTVVNTPANGGTQNNVSQAIVGNGLPASYGNNGFYTGIESNDTFAATYTGTYIYNQYAIVSTINACTDTDGDGVIDVIDIDDDNDGVLDIIESPACAMILRDDDANRLVWDFEGNLHTLPTTDYNAAQTQPYTLRTFGPGVVDVSGANVLRFTGATETNFDDAVANGDYMQYYFTTSTKYLSIDKVVNGTFAPANLKQGVIISTDPTFATYTVLDRGEVPFADVTPVLNNDLATYDNYSLNINTKYYVRFVYYGLTGTTQSAIDAVGLSFDEISNPQDCINGLDIDNDGIPNQLDLDSDGDGCPDTKEAILYNHSTETSIAGNVQNGNGGTVTSTVSTPNAMVPGPYGNNGFADALQSTSNPDVYKYVYSYQFVATDADVNTCDNKFLSDIDSDDDGIPDAIESPSCFYTEAQAMDITEGVSSDFTWVATNPLSNTYDDNTATVGAISAATAVSIQNKALITFDLPVIDAALIDNVKLNVGSVAFGGSATTGKWKLQGLDMNTALWTDLSDAAGQSMNTINTIYTFTNTLQPTIKYHKYRIIGIDNVNITNNAQLKEFSIVYKNYNPSLHRTKTGCNSDLDNDGVPNYLDRDSDGDGCPDAIEAGISKSLLVPANFFNVGGQVSGTHVIVGGTYGDNGLSNDVETPADSGILNYASTYNLYATDKDINLCTDTDNDGVPDVLDLDDDNDGILDAVESPNCFYTAAEAIIPVKISTGITTSTVNSVAVTPGNDIPTMHDTTISSATTSNHVVPANQLGTTSVVIYKIEYPTRLGLTQMVVTGNAVSWGAGSFAILEASNNDITYEAVSDPLATSSTSATKTWLVNNSLPTAANLYKYYRIRVSTVGSTQLTFTNYEVTGTLKTTTYAPSAHTKHGCVNDTDGDGISNHQDLDSDGDTCPDAAEAGTATQVGAGNAYPGTIVNVSGSSVVENAVVGAAGSYGINGFYNGIESNDTLGATYTGTYTYANAINAAISACFCYKPAITTGTVLDTNHGITSLQRAGTDNGNWPMVRKGAWTALESKTKPFVPNRLTNVQVAAIPSANLVKGMMVFNIDLDCLQININGTPAGWKCFDKQTCPTN